jgi:hypothetical protein
MLYNYAILAPDEGDQVDYSNWFHMSF